MFCLSACAFVLPGGLSETETPSADPTAAPTAAPTEVPAVTPDPNATPLPVYPTPGAIGKLCEGPIFPEPVKYLVLKGESDHFYVYNNMGELIRSFSAVDDEYAFGWPGFFGEDGICENVRIATGETVEPFALFGDFILRTEWYDDEGWGVKLTSVMDCDFNELFSFDPDEAPKLGECGGVLHIDGNYLVFGRKFDWNSSEEKMDYLYDPVLYDEHGNVLRTVDPEPFGKIYGVFGGKYIIGGTVKEGYEGYWYDEYDLSLFTLDGEVVMSDIRPEWSSSFCADDEMSQGILLSTDWLTDKNGVKRGADLNAVDEIPDITERDRLNLRYGNLDSYMEERGLVAISWGTVYAGVRTTDGEWLFRIYDPRFASDSDAEKTQYGVWGWE